MSVAPDAPAKSDKAVNEFKIPMTLNAASCAMLTVLLSPTISAHGEPSNCENTVFVHVSNVPLLNSLYEKVSTNP